MVDSCVCHIILPSLTQETNSFVSNKKSRLQCKDVNFTDSRTEPFRRERFFLLQDLLNTEEARLIFFSFHPISVNIHGNAQTPLPPRNCSQSPFEEEPFTNLRRNLSSSLEDAAKDEVNISPQKVAREFSQLNNAPSLLRPSHGRGGASKASMREGCSGDLGQPDASEHEKDGKKRGVKSFDSGIALHRQMLPPPCCPLSSAALVRQFLSCKDIYALDAKAHFHIVRALTPARRLAGEGAARFINDWNGFGCLHPSPLKNPSFAVGDRVS